MSTKSHSVLFVQYQETEKETVVVPPPSSALGCALFRRSPKLFTRSVSSAAADALITATALKPSPCCQSRPEGQCVLSQRATACLQQPPQPVTAVDDPASGRDLQACTQQLAMASASSPLGQLPSRRHLPLVDSSELHSAASFPSALQACSQQRACNGLPQLSPEIASLGSPWASSLWFAPPPKQLSSAVGSDH